MDFFGAEVNSLVNEIHKKVHLLQHVRNRRFLSGSVFSINLHIVIRQITGPHMGIEITPA